MVGEEEEAKTGEMKGGTVKRKASENNQERRVGMEIESNG